MANMGSTWSGIIVGGAAIVFGLIIGMGTTATASPLMEWSGSPVSKQAYSGRLTSLGADAAYFNPARLTGQDQSFEVGSSVLTGRLNINLEDRPAGVDISDSIYDARIADEDGRRSPPPQRPLPTDELPAERGSDDPSFTHRYLTTGAVLPLWSGRLVIGLMATISTERFARQTPHFSDEREQYFSNSLHFERLGDRLVGSTVAFGVGFEVIDELRLGVGATLAQDAESRNAIFSPDALQQDRSYINAEVEVSTRFVPHFGIDATPTSAWTISSTLHAPFENRVDGTGELRFWNFPAYPDGEDAVHQEFHFVYDFEPWRAGLGSSYRWADDDDGAGIEVGAEVLYGRWSDYVDRHGSHPSRQWSDTWTPTVTARWWAHNQEIGADLRFAPSPVPNQEGRSNFVDNSRWMASAGWSYDFEVFDIAARAGVHGQFQWLIEQRVQKSGDAGDPVIDEFPESQRGQSDETIEESLDFRTNNPGYPGYQTSGFVLGAGVFLKSIF